MEYFLGFNQKYPLPFEATAPIVETDGECEVLATLVLPYMSPSEIKFASIHSDPPGIPTDIPAVIRKRIGKGELIWSALPIESVGIYEYKKIFTSLLRSLISEHNLSFGSPDAPDDVKMTLFYADGYMTLNVCCVTERAANKTYAPFTVKVRCDSVPSAVKLLPSGADLPFEYEDGYVRFKTKELDIFDMYQIVK